MTEIIDIGNSKGVRIPKAIREQVGLSGEVTLAVKDDALVIRPRRKARAGWNAVLKAKLAAEDEGSLLPPEMANEFDDKDWTW